MHHPQTCVGAPVVRETGENYDLHDTFYKTGREIVGTTKAEQDYMFDSEDSGGDWGLLLTYGKLTKVYRRVKTEALAYMLGIFASLRSEVILACKISQKKLMRPGDHS